MKINTKVLNRVLGAGIVLAVCWWAYGFFDIGTKLTLRRAISNIKHGRELAHARKTLREMNDRRAVLDALKQALDEEDGTITGKTHVLQTLSSFKENRTVRRAIDSKVLSTRRAAVWVRGGTAANREAAIPVVLAWLRDAAADARSRAVVLCRKERLNIEEAVPDLLAILDSKPETPQDLDLIRQAMFALAGFQPEGLGTKLLAIAKDESQRPDLRAEALDALGRLENPPRDEMRKLLIAALKDKTATTLVRSKATNVLRKPSYGNEEVWDALESVLLDPSDTDSVTQRNCLFALGSSAPIDRLRRLLLDRRVYRHRFYGIRVDVASGLSVLNARERLTLEIMCEYLVDQDEMDKQGHVREEAWLTLYTLTGQAFGVREKELFQNPPRPFPNPEDAREFLWRASFMRPGVTRKHVEAIRKVSGNIPEMQKIRQMYQRAMDTIVEDWKNEAEGKKKPPPDPNEPQGPQPPKKDEVEPVGPVPPKDGG